MKIKHVCVFLCHPLFFWKQKHACNAAVVLFQAQMYPFSCTHIMLRNSFSSMRALVSKKAYAALYFNAASISSLNLTWNQLSSWFSFKHAHSCLEKDYAVHAFYFGAVSISSCNSTLDQLSS